jgi:Asp-tRNA(Asn)/Glu-tRNA(Gln) amidotransferase A subunit family amidase
MDITTAEVNAVADQLFEEARQQAKTASDRYVSHPDEAGPLEGLPVAAKAEQPMQGRRWTDAKGVVLERH